MADVGTDEAKRISLQMSKESNVLLKNKNGFLPFTPEDDIVLIGHVADSWYMDWYGGKPLYKVTLKAGIEKKMRRPVPYDSGLNLVRFRVGNQYVGGSRPAVMPRSFAEPEPAELVLVDQAEDAVVFEQTNWGSGSHFLYAPAYRKYLTVGVDGKISLSSDEPYGLKKLQQRLKLFYGDECGLRIESGQEGGLSVTIIARTMTCEEYESSQSSLPTLMEEDFHETRYKELT